MKINIYSRINGAGLQKDYELIRDLLQYKYEIDFDDYLGNKRADPGDVAFHMEIPRFEIMRLCPKNYFVPNPEWLYPNWRFKMKQFDGIWAKTKDTENIFKTSLFRHDPDSVHYLGFLAEDIYLHKVQKERYFLHVAGQSETKGTLSFIQAYTQNKELPQGFLIGCRGWEKYMSGVHNLEMLDRLEWNQLRTLYNACQVHVCPSKYEGYGHYLHEGKSCKAVIITTNGAPMNEFITDKRFLIDVAGEANLQTALIKDVKVSSLIEKIEYANSLSDKELSKAGDANRIDFQQKNEQFKKRLFNFISTI